jgi:hypothetical protein
VRFLASFWNDSPTVPAVWFDAALGMESANPDGGHGG